MKKRIGSIASVFLLCLAAGCNYIRVSVVPSFPQGQVKRVAVLEFDYKKYRSTIIDKVSHGVSTARNPGLLTASLVSVALADWGRYDVVRRDQITLKLRAEKIPEPGVIYQLGRAEVGRLLGVDAVVIGAIDAYESAFFLMVQSAKVVFTARCMDVATGQEIWKMEVNMKEYYTSEERLIAAAMRQVVEQLRAKTTDAPVEKPEK
ncbi:MAG: GNA1162 family protein [Planctomycetota bacterium]